MKVFKISKKYKTFLWKTKWNVLVTLYWNIFMLLTTISFSRSSFFLYIWHNAKRSNSIFLFADFPHFLACLQHTSSNTISLEVSFTSWPALHGNLLASLAVRICPSHVVCTSRKFCNQLTLLSFPAIHVQFEHKHICRYKELIELI